MPEQYNPFEIEGISYEGYTGGLSFDDRINIGVGSDYQFGRDIYEWGGTPDFQFNVSTGLPEGYNPLFSLGSSDLVDAIATLGFNQYEGLEGYDQVLADFTNMYSEQIGQWAFDAAEIADLESRYATDMEHAWETYDTWTQAQAGEGGVLETQLSNLESNYLSGLEDIEIDKQSQLREARMSRNQALQAGMQELKSKRLQAGRGIGGGGSLAFKNLQEKLGKEIRQNIISQRGIRDSAQAAIAEDLAGYDFDVSGIQTGFSDQLELQNLGLSQYLETVGGEFELEALDIYEDWYAGLIQDMTTQLSGYTAPAGFEHFEFNPFSSEAYTEELATVGETTGCTYPDANNYDPQATIDDGSCEYGTEPGSHDLGAGDEVVGPTDTDPAYSGNCPGGESYCGIGWSWSDTLCQCIEEGGDGDLGLGGTDEGGVWTDPDPEGTCLAGGGVWTGGGCVEADELGQGSTGGTGGNIVFPPGWGTGPGANYGTAFEVGMHWCPEGKQPNSYGGCDPVIAV
ncbi:MAG: hypothetical protein GOVbin2066_66 [Prokaryotic dsDNA virus sp.]|nr:MAG: hypothetical protein GOVbin2066_66 [Prokaryotic dsDNA virus sp.]